jgi:hypothetical protein
MIPEPTDKMRVLIDVYHRLKGLALDLDKIRVEHNILSTINEIEYILAFNLWEQISSSRSPGIIWEISDALWAEFSDQYLGDQHGDPSKIQKTAEHTT